MVGNHVEPNTFLIGDEARIRQILTNLVGNALKFTERGTIRIDSHYQNGDLILEVSDTGPGIPENYLHDIFEPFSQEDYSLTRQHRGTGLGLAISRDLAKTMKGQLEVQSQIGKGSTFTVRLPLTQTPPRQSPLTKETSTSPGSTRP